MVGYTPAIDVDMTKLSLLILFSNKNESISYSPAITVSVKSYLPPVRGKSFNFRLLSFSSPLKCASSKMRSSDFVSCVCMCPINPGWFCWAMVFAWLPAGTDNTFAILHGENKLQQRVLLHDCVKREHPPLVHSLAFH